MATLFRRKLARFVEKDETPVSLSISRPEGMVTLSKREVQRYSMLLSMLDSDGDGEVGGAEGASFLRRSGLDTEHLREIWRLASGGTSKPRLVKEDFFIACKLIAVTQSKGDPDFRTLVTGETLPLADFHYDLVPDIPAGGTAEAVPPSAVKVVVSEPTTFGTGLDKHTRYRVSTTTVLSQFSRKEMSVWRRFSDFEWLHKRLSTCFPAAIIPLFPAKRLVGNSDAAFIKDRMTTLEAYVDGVAHHPTLNNSLDLLVFLDASDEGLEAAKRYIEEKESEEAESLVTKGVDLVLNLAATGQAVPPLALKVDEEFISACASHGAVLARLAAAVRNGSTLDAAQRAACESMVNLGRAMLALAGHERANAALGTADAVSAAASAARRTEAALFTGSSTGGGGAGSASASSSGGDAAAAAAFSAHSAAAVAAQDGSIAGMFSGDFSDPYSSLGAAALGGGRGGAAGGSSSSSSSSVSGGGLSGTPTDVFVAVASALGEALMAAGNRQVESLSKFDEILFSAFRVERDREAELGEAIKRRDASMGKVQEANAVLQRKKKALSGLKPSDPQYNIKVGPAQEGVQKVRGREGEGEEGEEGRSKDAHRLTLVPTLPPFPSRRPRPASRPAAASSTASPRSSRSRWPASPSRAA
jgi:hypothetical protein